MTELGSCKSCSTKTHVNKEGLCKYCVVTEKTHWSVAVDMNKTMASMFHVLESTIREARE